MSEKPVRDRPRRLANWLNPTGDKKVHSSEDQIPKQRRAQAIPLRNAILNSSPLRLGALASPAHASPSLPVWAYWGLCFFSFRVLQCSRVVDAPLRKLDAGNPHVQFERRTEASTSVRLLRPDTCEAG